MLYFLIYVFIGLVLAGLVGPRAIEATIEERGIPEEEQDKAHAIGMLFLAVFVGLLWPMILASAIARRALK
jgi:hypothetical protein